MLLRELVKVIIKSKRLENIESGQKKFEKIGKLGHNYIALYDIRT